MGDKSARWREALSQQTPERGIGVLPRESSMGRRLSFILLPVLVLGVALRGESGLARQGKWRIRSRVLS